jgi:hypothetical protein
MASKLEVPTTDKGEVHFGVDFGAGLVHVTMRAPLSISKQTVGLRIVDFMEIAADILTQSCKLQKAQAQHFASSKPA